MANYDPSNLALAQARLINKFKTEELKFREPVTFRKFTETPQIMFPDHKVLRTREDRPVTAYTGARSQRALGNGRSHNHVGTKGDSIALTPSWVTYNDVFAISLKQADNNVLTMAEMLDNEFANVVANFAEGLESLAIDYVFDNRSTVNVGNGNQGTFNGLNSVYEITDATFGEQAVQITQTIMEENDLLGPYIVFCDSLAYDKFRYQANQGTGNSTNLSFQFDNATFVRSIGLDDGTRFGQFAYTQGVWVAVPMNDIACLDWIPVQNREGKDTKEQIYTTLQNPVDGLTYAMHIYSERSDETATNGYTQDERDEYEISIDIALESAPLSNAGETVLQAFALV